jgi:MFS family permease
MPLPEKRRGFNYGWVVLAASFLIGMVVFGTRFSFGVFFKALQDDFGWTRAETSGVFSIYMVLCAGVPVFMGWLSDKYGPRLAICLAGFFTGASLLLTSRADALWQLYLTYSLLLALGTGGVYAIIMSTISRWFTEKRGFYMGIAGAGGGIGTLIMTPVAAQLITTYGWRRSSLIIAIVAWVIVIASGLLMRKQPVRARAMSLPDMTKNQSINIPPPAVRFPEISLRNVLRTKDFWLMFSTWFLYSLCSYLVTTHIVPHGRDLGLSALTAASLLSILGGVSVVGRVLMGRASDSVGRKWMLVAGAIVQAAALLLLAYATSEWLLFLFAVTYGFVRGGIDVCVGALIAERFGLRRIGLIMGILSMGYDFGAAIGPVLGGFVFDVTSSYQVAFLVGSGLSVIMVVIVACISSTPAQSGAGKPVTHSDGKTQPWK